MGGNSTQWGALLRVCVIPSRADAPHGGKARSRAEAPGSSGSQGSLGGVGVSAQCRGKQDNCRDTGVGSFPRRGQPCKISWAWREGTAKEFPTSGIGGWCEDTTGQGSFSVLFLTLLPTHNTRDLAQLPAQMSQEWQEQGLGLPGWCPRLWSGAHLSWPRKHLSQLKRILKFCSVCKIIDVNNLTIFMNKAVATQILMTHCLLKETP